MAYWVEDRLETRKPGRNMVEVTQVRKSKCLQ